MYLIPSLYKELILSSLLSGCWTTWCYACQGITNKGKVSEKLYLESHMFNSNWARILALWLDKLISTPLVIKSLGLGQIEVLQHPQNTKHWPMGDPGKKNTSRRLQSMCQTYPVVFGRYIEEMLPHFTSSISNAALLSRSKMQEPLRQTSHEARDSGRTISCCFEAAVLIYHLHTASLETKSHI